MARPKKKRASRKPGPKAKRSRRREAESSPSNPVNPKAAVESIMQTLEERVASRQGQLRRDQDALRTARKLKAKLGRAG